MNRKTICAGVLAGVLVLGWITGGSAEWQEEKKGKRVISRVWVDENGLKATAPEGYTEVTYSYSGSTVTEKYFDAKGNPAKSAGGYFGQELTYRNKNLLTEAVFLDENGQKTECAAGYARVKIVYTSFGQVTQAAYYDEDNDPVTVPSLGYAQLRNDFRGKTMTRTTYMDEDGTPVDTPLGYAVKIQKVNKKNRVLEISFEHADGSPAVGEDGWAVMKRELDEKDREISLKYYDFSGQMTDRGMGYAYEVKTWKNDREYVIRRYDLQNRQVDMGRGYSCVRCKLNRSGQIVSEIYLDASGNETESSDGVASREYEYDENGQITGMEEYDIRGIIQQ